LGAAAWIAGAIKGAPFVFHVQDLQPDAALGLGMLRPNTFTRLLYLLETIAYCKACRVSGITHGMLDRFREKGVAEEKLVYFPNSVDPVDFSALPAPGAFRARNGIRADDFLAVYSGNLGYKQGIEIIVDAAKAFTRGKMKMVICGAGSQRGHLVKMIDSSGLGDKVLLLPLQDSDSYREMLVDADVCLITQQRGSGQSFFPSKLLTALAYAKPVVTVAEEDSELFRAHLDGGFGPNVFPDQPAELAQTLEKLAASPALLAPFSRAARSFGKQFETGTVLDSFEESLRSILKDP
jgi:colanic acid biosynthesis glycosyl transferase WcaI